ncbi:MAG: hypothetical protein ABI037_06940 [Gemmatimonadales bacterium]
MSSIDLQFRPGNYWDASDPLTAILANIKGENRRQMVRDFITGQAPAWLGEIDPDLLDDTLEVGVRNQLITLHPSWMGGEYLPPYLPGEGEIARIVLASTTQDVISVRARRRRSGERIIYRIVDEYHDVPNNRYTCSPQSSVHPLSLGELIQLIDHAGHAGLNPDGKSLTDNLCELQEGASPNDLCGFVTVESPFYPQLEEYFDWRQKRWVERKTAELGLEDADECTDDEDAD